MITLTSYDSDECHCDEECEFDEKLVDEKCVDENVVVECVVPIVIDVTPPTPPSTTPTALQCQQMIPIVFVSFDDDEPGKERNFHKIIRANNYS